jgi:hypothetical protein
MPHYYETRFGKRHYDPTPTTICGMKSISVQSLVKV